MGLVMRGFRTHPHHGRAIPQEVAAGWVGLTQSALSRCERGEHAFTEAKLMSWAHTLGLPEHLRWFSAPNTAQQVSKSMVPVAELPTVAFAEADRSVTGSSADGPCVLMRIEGRDVLVPVDRRTVLSAGLRAALGSVTDAFAPPTHRPREAVKLTAPAQVDDLLAHLRDQWHMLVKTDNLLGPRYAVRGVLDQLSIIEGVLESVTVAARREVARLGAQYAESASWLYEDSRDLATAYYWNNRAMEWAHEAGDDLLLSWTLFRRSQQVVSTGNATHVLSLAHAAGRSGEALLPPMRAAIAQQEAVGHSMDGDERSAQRKLDEARQWAATDIDGDARNGHGSFCTASYIEVQRAGCWLTLGKPKRAIELYESTVPQVPTVYRRDRGMALGRLARAYSVVGEPEQAARAATDALDIARSVGSARTIAEVQIVGQRLKPYRQAEAVAQLLDELGVGQAS
jgi:tetratricopeptide (TPR) repeat protein